MGFEHAMESVQEFAHDGDQGLHLELAGREQMLVESAEVRVVLHGHQGGHVESAAPPGQPSTIDGRWLFAHGSEEKSGVVFSRYG
jgi:hypothetical protein